MFRKLIFLVDSMIIKCRGSPRGPPRGPPTPGQQMFRPLPPGYGARSPSPSPPYSPQMGHPPRRRDGSTNCDIYLFLFSSMSKTTFVHTHAQKPTFLMSSLCCSSEFDLFLVHNLSVWVRISDVGADLNTRGPPPGHHPRFRGARYRGGPGGVRPGYPGGGGGLHPSQSSSSVISLGAHQGPFTYDVCKIL